MMEAVVDLRGLPVWERAETVLERARGLRAGESFEFKMECEPRALAIRLEQETGGMLHCRWEWVGEDEWHVSVSPFDDAQDASPLTTALRRSAFHAVSADTLSVFAEAMSEHTAHKNEVICEENALCGSVGVVLEGAFASFAGNHGRDHVLCHLFPFDVFGAAEFFDRGFRIGRIVAISKIARYATIPHAVVQEMAKRDPQVLLALGSCCAQRMRGLANRLSEHVSKPILVRVAGALLPYAPPARGLQPAHPPLPAMTQTQIAASAGTVKEVAARAIADLERAGAVRREHGHIRFLDRSKLLEIADAG